VFDQLQVVDSTLVSDDAYKNVMRNFIKQIKIFEFYIKFDKICLSLNSRGPILFDVIFDILRST